MPNSIFPEAQEGGSCSWEAPPRGEHHHHHHHHHHQEKDSFLKGPAAWPSSSLSYYASPPSSSASLSPPSSASSSRTSSASSSLATSPRNHHHFNYVPGFVNVSKRREAKMTAVAPAPLPVHHSNPFYSPEYLRQYASHHHNQQHQHQHQHQHPRRGACPDMKWTTPRGGFHTNSWCQAPRAKKPEKRSSQDRKFKTKMCRYLERNGYCPHGQECCFAHHPDELRPEPEDKRRKTRPCMFFFQDGYCPFGKHCHFLHTLEEKKLSEKGRELAAFMRFKKSTRLPIFEELAPSQEQQQ